MIIWVFTLLDLLVLVIASLAHFKIAFLSTALIISGAYLIIKFAIFREVMSGIDAVFGIYLILMTFFSVPGFMYYLMLGWFLYKIISAI